MLAQITPEALVALDGLQRQPRWRDVNNMLEAEIASWTERLLSAADARQIGEYQGRIKALKDFLSMVRDAPAAMEKLGLRSPL